MVAKSSSTFIFYRLQQVPLEDEDNEGKQGRVVLQWKQYHTLHMQGFIFFQKGTNSFTVVTDKLIYFYRIPRDNDLFVPQLRGTMFNYMQCTGFQLDSLGLIAASFKTNQPNIDIYERKLNHGFHEIIHRESKEGVCGSNITSLNCFIISDDNYIELHDAENFKVLERLDLHLQESET